MPAPNPFAQSPQYWKVAFDVPAAAAGTAEAAFGDMALSVSAFETDEKGHIWTIEVLCEASPDMAEVKRRLLIAAELHGVPLPEAQLREVKQEDWLAKVARDFPPLAIGRFYVHGAHVKEPPPPGSLPILVDAGAAFGSGEHGTTAGCLEALDGLARKHAFRNVLDMGCGSGILAIAAARLWNAEVTAADIDPVAVRVAEENIRRNHVQVTALVSDGYASERIRRAAPFDLIVSNILARPLMAFAPDLKAHLAPGGRAVLSGLLVSQEAGVLKAHAMQGLKLERRFVHGEWCTLLLR